MNNLHASESCFGDLIEQSGYLVVGDFCTSVLGLPGVGAKGDKPEYIDAVSTRSGVCKDILRCTEIGHFEIRNVLKSDM